MSTSSTFKNTSGTTTAPVVVFGDGSAAVFLVSQLVQQEQAVLWSSGTGSRVLPVMPFVKSELALGALMAAQKMISDDVFAHPVEKGIFHRVFRNKGFKLPIWKRTASPEAQTDAFEELVWAPEKAYLGVREYRIAGLSPTMVEQSLRAALENHPLITRVASAPIVEFEVFETGGKVQFANGPEKNGEIYEFSRFYYCDSVAELKTMPKLATVFKHQIGTAKMGSRMSAIQVMFQHSTPLNQDFDTGIVIPMNREAGEDFDRDVLGYFFTEHTTEDAPEVYRSVWTVFMQPDETEENHEIMKKFRKLKQSLNKAFDSPEFLPEGKKDFMSTVEKEQVRFEEGYILTEGTFKPSKSNHDFVLITDAFGLSAALEGIARHFEIEPVEFSGDVLLDTKTTELMDDYPEASAHMRDTSLFDHGHT